MKFSKTAAALAAAVSVAVSAGTTPTATTAPSAGGESSALAAGALKITVLPKNLGNPYFETSNKGAEAAAATSQ